MSTLTAIARDEPAPIRDIVQGMPPELDRILSRCLRKDPERRFQTAADLKVALQEVKEESESGRLAVPATSAPARRRASRTLIAAAALLAVGVAAAIWFLGGRHPKREALMVMTRLTSDSGLTTDATISPDGKLVAYASDRAGEDNLDIWLQQVAGGSPIRLTNNQADDRDPNFSPDGSRIAFRSEREGGGIYIISTLGGEERLIARNGLRPRFSPDGNWVAYHIGRGLRSSSIYIVSSTGGSPRELKLSIPWATEPVWSPDGKHLLFKGSTDPIGQNRDWWVASPEGGQAIQTGAAAVLGPDGMAGPMRIPPPQVWAGDRIVFSAELGDATNLFRIAIKPNTWRISDPPQRLTTGASHEWGPSLSTDGRVVFAAEDGDVSLWTLAIDLNRGKLLGKPERLTSSGSWNIRPTLSTDGRRLVFLSDRSGTTNVWIRDMVTGKESALTTTPSTHALIAPDGSKVVYASAHNAKIVLDLVPTGRGVAEKLCEDCGLPMDWSLDGKRILYYWGHPIRHSAVDVVTREKVDVIKHPKYNLHRPHYSPDGKWLAFHVPLEAEQGRAPIFIAPLRNGEAAGESEWIQVTDGAGIEAAPWWSPDGKILYFLSQRDGFQCIWAQHLDQASKRPAGAPFDVAHFHGARHKIQESGFGPAIGIDQLVFALSESTGNIWMAQPRAQN